MDKGSEFLGGDSKRVIDDHGIKLSTTSRYSSKTNGKVEKFNQDIMKRVRPLVAQAKMSLDFREYAAEHTIEMMNRKPSKLLDNMLPLLYLIDKISQSNTGLDIPAHNFENLAIVKIKYHFIFTLLN